MSVVIRESSVAELEQSPEMAGLLAGYATESGMPEMGGVTAQFGVYRAMEQAGMLTVFGAFNPSLVGFLLMTSCGLPHYGGRKMCSTESYFVAPHARATGAGLKLLRAAEAKAAELGAAALLVSAPAGGRLAEVMPRCGYREANRVFVRGLQ